MSKKIISLSSGFTSRLIALLETCHVTQEDLARHLGVSQGTISGWVNGAIPRRRTAKALAETFGVMPDWLVYGDGEKFPPGRYQIQISGLLPAKFDPPLNERSVWPQQPAGLLDRRALKELSAKLNEAAGALSSCAKIISKSAGHKRGRKRKRSTQGK